MKIAVIGGGTAGYIAAAHLTKYFPQFELYHIYDSRIPTIGVGEGTTPNFPTWLTDITGLYYPKLKDRCKITLKYGIFFENWGVKYKQFMHNLYPISETYAYHISADKIVELLQDYISATHIDKKVIDLKSNGVAVDIVFEDNTYLKTDIAIDARGFPKSLDENHHIKLSLIPTNAALIRQCPEGNKSIINFKIENQVLQYNSATRTVARPHGWIFVIPLTHRTSYGYVYNSSINSVAEIAADFDEFLRLEEVTTVGQDRKIHFPNFTHRTLFDGALFKLGNAASFLEPLEATAIGVILMQMLYFSHWPLEHLSKNSKRAELNPKNIEVFNRFLLKKIYRLSVFVGWHYSMGSSFDTEFWRFAQSNFHQEIKKLEYQDVKCEFETYIQAGSKLPHSIKNYQQFSMIAAKINEEKEAAKIESATRKSRFFSFFPPESFAEIGYGINYFPEVKALSKDGYR
jgi:tryptophan halogenase